MSNKKKIYVDITCFAKLDFITGIQRVVIEVVSRMLEKDDLDIVLIKYMLRKGKYKIISSNDFMEEYKNRKIDQKIRKGYIYPNEFEEGSIFFDIDSTWGSIAKRSYLYPILKKSKVKIITNVYDIIPFNYPYFTTRDLGYAFIDYIGAVIKYSDIIITNSNAVKVDVIELAEKIGLDVPHIEVAGLGADFDKSRKISDKTIEKLGEVTSKKYILMVGTVEIRKNHKLLFDAYENGLKEQGYSIVFAGNIGWKVEELITKMRKHPDYNKNIFILNGLSNEAIDYLYQNARYVAFLSYTEGFGLPIVEALAKGVPVISYGTKINMETGSKWCKYCMEDKGESLAKLVKEIDDNNIYDDWKKEIVNDYKYLSWDEAANNFIKIIENC